MDANQQMMERHQAALVWKARPIFLSSTFRDMHAERDYLREHGFKDLEVRLRERCHYLDIIDLRQGVETGDAADEAEREMRVLKVCLDEIERSKPFLVALLGDRYGWTPPPARIEAAARDAGLPPTVDVAGKSVTELEILYGVLENPDQRKRSRFYFRTVDRTGMPPEVAAKFPAESSDPDDPGTPAGRLKALKARIKRELPDRWRDYTLRWDPARKALTGLEAFDADVEKDLWADLEPETAAYLRDAPKTWQEADARAVADFVAERTRGYVERPAVTDAMLAHALSPAAPDADWAVVVTGAPGSGKSSLFGRAYQALTERAASGEVLLLSHAAGIFPLSGSVDRMLRRWISELAAWLGVPDPIVAAAAEQAAPSERMGEKPRITSEDIEKAFSNLLARAARTVRVVVLVDALNQFEPTIRARYLTWLPKVWPANARFIVTTLPGYAGTPITEKPGCRDLTVPPVSRDEARAIAERFYRERHHRAVNLRVLDVLLDQALPDGASAHGNPLWLVLALQEMNLLEADDFERADREFVQLEPAVRIEELQLSEARRLPPDIPGVYGELLARAERTCGTGPTRAFTGLVAVSRSGWRESDLRDLIPRVSAESWDELVFAGIRRALGLHVVQRGAYAQWDFFHASLRQTVLQRDLPDEAGQRRLHGILTDHLLALPEDDPLRISETMFHIFGEGDMWRGSRYLASLGNGEQWQFNIDAARSNSLDYMMDTHSRRGGEGTIAVLVDAIEGKNRAGNGLTAVSWTLNLLDIPGLVQSDVHVLLDLILFFLNDGLYIRARAESERQQLLEAVAQRFEEMVTRGGNTISAKRDLALCYTKLGNLCVRQGNYEQALAFYRNNLELHEDLKTINPQFCVTGRANPPPLDSFGHSGPWGWGNGILSRRDPVCARLNLGDLYMHLQRYREAQECYQAALLLTQETLQFTRLSLPEFCYDFAVCHCRLGDLYSKTGHHAKAVEFFNNAVRIASELLKLCPEVTDFHKLIGDSDIHLGMLCRRLGEEAKSLEFFQKAIVVREKLRTTHPDDADVARDLALARYMLGEAMIHIDPLEALQHTMDACGILKRLADEGRLPDKEAAQVLEKLEHIVG